MYKLYIKRPFHKPDFYIETEIEELYETLKLIYGPFISNENPCLLSEAEVYRMSFLDTPPSYDELQHIENAMYEMINIDEDYLAVHSAVIVKDGMAYLFAGYTEAGKSTLTAYLCSMGFEYFSDDLAIINKEDLSVFPYPRPVQLRDGGVAVLNKYGVDLSDAPVYSYGGIKRTNKVFPPSGLKNARLGGIMFIERTEDVNSSVSIPKTESFPMIMRNLYVLKDTNAELMNLIRRLCDAPVYSIKYKDMEFVRQWLHQQM